MKPILRHQSSVDSSTTLYLSEPNNTSKCEDQILYHIILTNQQLSTKLILCSNLSHSIITLTFTLKLNIATCKELSSQLHTLLNTLRPLDFELKFLIDNLKLTTPTSPYHDIEPFHSSIYKSVLLKLQDLDSQFQKSYLNIQDQDSLNIVSYDCAIQYSNDLLTKALLDPDSPQSFILKEFLEQETQRLSRLEFKIEYLQTTEYDLKSQLENIKLLNSQYNEIKSQAAEEISTCQNLVDELRGQRVECLIKTRSIDGLKNENLSRKSVDSSINDKILEVDETTSESDSDYYSADEYLEPFFQNDIAIDIQSSCSYLTEKPSTILLSKAPQNRPKKFHKAKPHLN